MAASHEYIRPLPRVFTFYSYKGGVGRSMALASVATILSATHRVLVIDWDLEAPGIERFFVGAGTVGAGIVAERTGIVDLADARQRGSDLPWRQCLTELHIHSAVPPIGLITAGRRDGGYVARMQSIDWEALFAEFGFGLYLEQLRNDWLADYDFVLIDSRTGISDIGGICTINLPDALVAFLTSNHQSLDGIAEIARRARAARGRLPFDRGHLIIIPVLARDESRTEYTQARGWRTIIAETLGELYNDFLPKGVTALDALERLRVPNVPYWSFGERIPALVESTRDPDKISYSYAMLARLMSSGLHWSATVEGATSAPPVEPPRPRDKRDSARVVISHTPELRQLPRGRSFVDAAEAAVLRIRGAVADSAHRADDSSAESTVGALGTADVYVGIIGFEYGSPVRGRPELSYPELEFEAASSSGLPRLVFLLDESAQLPTAVDRRHGERQRAFRRRLEDAGVVTARVTSPAELETALFRALVELTTTGNLRPAPLYLAPSPIRHAVRRPHLMDLVLALLDGSEGEGTPLILGLRGAGGFGKTTLAALVCEENRSRFPGGVMWVTIGQQVAGAELAAKINDLSLQLSTQRPTFVDPEQAGRHLGRLLGDENRLLVIDDVWRPEQLAPFLSDGPGCTRLVTTRIDSVLPDGAVSVLVDAMSSEEALSVLKDGLSDIGETANLNDLLLRAGRWPVLLRLINSAIRRWVNHGASVDEAVRRVGDSLAAGGPAGVDWHPSAALDVFDPQARASAVSATVEASLNVLRASGLENVDRYVELAVFPDDVDIPVATVELLWGRTGGMDWRSVERLCLELADLSLIQEYRLTPIPLLRIHDVLLDYLRSRAGERVHPALHRHLLDAHRRTLPASGAIRTAWWTMGDSDRERYLWEHLTHHLLEASRDGGSEYAELEALVSDLRWVVAKLYLLGPPAIHTDLALASSDMAQRLQRHLARSAHLFDSIDPPAALGATVLSRLQDAPELEPIVHPYAMAFSDPRLTPAWPLPDVPHPAAVRAFSAGGAVEALAVDRNGVWLAAASAGRSLQLWNLADGSRRTTLAGHPAWISALAAGPDGSWLASAGYDRSVRLWSMADGSLRRRLTGHAGPVLALAVSPDGSWLASAGEDGRVCLWSTADGTLFARLAGHEGAVRALAVDPDGAWLASAGDDRAIRLWEVAAEGLPLATLTGHSDAVRALAVSPDGRWLASGGDDRGVRLWNAGDGAPRATLEGHTAWVRALVFGPDGTWFASAGDDRVVRLWNTDTGLPRATLTGHTDAVRALAAGFEGSRLVSGGYDSTVRLWTSAADPSGAAPAGHAGPMRTLVAAPDGSWLASEQDRRN
jgi:cellulose biosynthesis protein BcsQ